MEVAFVVQRSVFLPRDLYFLMTFKPRVRKLKSTCKRSISFLSLQLSVMIYSWPMDIDSKRYFRGLRSAVVCISTVSSLHARMSKLSGHPSNINILAFERGLKIDGASCAIELKEMRFWLSPSF